MSEPEVAEAEVEAAVEEVAEAPKEQPSEEVVDEVNPMFRALFDAAEEEGEPEAAPPRPSSLTDAMFEIEAGPEAEEPEATPEAEPVQEEKEPEASTPQKKGKKVKQVIDPEVPEDPEAPEEEVAFQPEGEDRAVVESLTPDERVVYDAAKFASSEMEEYNNLDGQFLDYFKKSQEYVAQRVADDPFVELVEDEGYRKFVEVNRPKFTQHDAKKVEQEMLVHKAEERALAKMRPEVDRLRREQELARMKPVVEKKKHNFRVLSKEIIPEDVRKLLAEGGEDAIKSLSESNPMEFQLMDQVSGNLLMLADTFIDVSSRVVEYDPQNNIHKELVSWVQQEQDTYVKSGDTKKDGKVFMRRERFAELPEDKKAEYFTWSDDDLLSIMAVRAQQQLEHLLTSQRETLAKAGYVKQQPPQQAQAPQPPQQPKAPQVAPTPRQGGGEQSAVRPEPVTPLSVLGM